LFIAGFLVFCLVFDLVFYLVFALIFDVVFIFFTFATAALQILLIIPWI